MDYKNGRIYKVVNDVNNDIYIGSTTQLLCKRMATHRSYAKLKPNRKLYKCMNSVGIEHFKIILLENYACNNREELNSREEHYRNLLKPSLNSNRCHITDDDIRQYQKDYDKNYRTEHYEDIKQYQKEYYEQHKDHLICDVCKGKYNHSNKSRHEKTLRHHKALEAIAPQ